MKCGAWPSAQMARRSASAGEDRTVRLWDVASHQAVGEPITGHNDVVMAVAFSLTVRPSLLEASTEPCGCGAQPATNLLANPSPSPIATLYSA